MVAGRWSADLGRKDVTLTTPLLKEDPELFELVLPNGGECDVGRRTVRTHPLKDNSRPDESEQSNSRNTCEPLLRICVDEG